jgi:hypothetical protein
MQNIECTKRVELARRYLTVISSIATRGAYSETLECDGRTFEQIKAERVRVAA